MARAFASQADMAEKKITFSRLSEHAYAFTAEGDPNTGIVVGDDAVMVVDAQATPKMAHKVIEYIRTVTDKPIKYVVLSHYHAVRVLGASGFEPQHIICSEATREMIVERGAQDYKSELQRFPRLFQAAETIPGLTWPTITFDDRMSLWLGKLQVDIIHAGRGHTKGDTIVWLPEERTLFSGDLVEYGATPYAGDAHYKDWPETLQKLRDLKALALVPGRGDALMGEGAVEEGIAGTQAFLSDLYKAVSQSAEAGDSLKQAYDKAMAALQPRYGNWVIFEHCMPFDVSRAYDEAKGLDHPRIWTAERDIEMWAALEKADDVMLERGHSGAHHDHERLECRGPSMSSYDYRHYPYRRPPELDGKAARRPVVIVGAGMAGPTLALELAARGVPSVVLDEDDTVSIGSRSICQAKHSLEVWDRFGIAQRMVDKGITWEQGEVYLRDQRDLPLQPAARARPQVPGLREPAAVLRRGIPLRALPGRAG